MSAAFVAFGAVEYVVAIDVMYFGAFAWCG